MVINPEHDHTPWANLQNQKTHIYQPPDSTVQLITISQLRNLTIDTDTEGR